MQASKVFSSIALLNMLRKPLQMFPKARVHMLIAPPRMYVDHACSEHTQVPSHP